jgi:hypothetical protein
LKIRERLAKLIDIKSIITILLTGVFCYLCISGAIAANVFMPVFATVIAFYFGTQAQKNKTE